MFNSIRERPEYDVTVLPLFGRVLFLSIIAILIAIAIPTFLGARQRAQDKQAQSNIRNALTTEKTFYVDNQAYTATVASLSAIENSLDFSTLDASLRGVVPTLVKVGTDVAGGVCLESDSKSGSKFFLVDITAGTQAGTWYGKYASGAGARCPAGDAAAPSGYSRDAATCG